MHEKSAGQSGRRSESCARCRIVKRRRGRQWLWQRYPGGKDESPMEPIISGARHAEKHLTTSQMRAGTFSPRPSAGSCRKLGLRWWRLWSRGPRTLSRVQRLPHFLDRPLHLITPRRMIKPHDGLILAGVSPAPVRCQVGVGGVRILTGGGPGPATFLLQTREIVGGEAVTGPDAVCDFQEIDELQLSSARLDFISSSMSLMCLCLFVASCCALVCATKI